MYRVLYKRMESEMLFECTGSVLSKKKTGGARGCLNLNVQGAVQKIKGREMLFRFKG